MTEKCRKVAIEYIEGQLENGYVDLSWLDQNELEVVKEAIGVLKMVDKFNSIGCTSFRLTADELKKILEKECGAN